MIGVTPPSLSIFSKNIFEFLDFAILIAYVSRDSDGHPLGKDEL